ncbi:glycosyl transferase [Rhizobium wenxiniae]|uniref:O-linked N-acetylglucosamine transferase, SPINDLY family protein n=1 Tax=Rhizobium wenxiniae TaxID=1737357 RepID=UPI001C6DE513|nr:glycosyltransferase family 41 protein [Rhizobium wenxiniae]MBW9090147.1 glycosyl transferase [Rhizobium wenxiniae]
MNEISYKAASQLFRNGQFTESLITINKLLDAQRDARTYMLLARTLKQLGHKNEAASAFQLAAELGGQHADDNLIDAIKLNFEIGEKDKALALASRILPKLTRDPELGFIVASLLVEKGQARTARVFKTMLINSKELPHMLLGARISLHTWDLFDPSDVETARVLLNRIPNSNPVRLMYLTFSREHSRHDAIERHQPIIDAAIAAGELDFLKRDGPFFNIHWTGDEHLNQLARSNTPRFSPEMTTLRHKLPHAWGDKIRIAYLSSDLFDKHATMKLIRRVLELHDRDRFEITLLCHSDSAMLETNDADRSEWGDIVTVRDMDDATLQAEIKARNIDILVDLKGHTKGTRNTVFNMQAAPIQVAWLGFPGSTLNVDLDYVIGDRYVLPDSSKPHYYEKFCRLPETYQPNDPFHRPLAKPPTRKDVGLPEDAFIYASFNANRKITPKMLDMWAEMVKSTPNSILWILCHASEGRTNIQKKLVASGVPAKRIFFMSKLHFEYHINRIPLADLGLDTYPVNGHTTTSEQLWAGLPVLTYKGTNFASRVSESLLNAIDLPELIAEDADDYLRKAIEFGSNPELIKPLRQRLNDNRLKSPLFDAERFTRHIETAYEMMVDRARQGLKPDHFDVACLPPRTEPFMEKLD